MRSSQDSSHPQLRLPVVPLVFASFALHCSVQWSNGSSKLSSGWRRLVRLVCAAIAASIHIEAIRGGSFLACPQGLCRGGRGIVYVDGRIQYTWCPTYQAQRCGSEWERHARELDRLRAWCYSLDDANVGGPVVATRVFRVRLPYAETQA